MNLSIHSLTFLLSVILILSINFEKSQSTPIWPAVVRGASFVASRALGPSGKPMQHFILKGSRKGAEDAARNAGKGNKPIHHAPHGPGQKPHYHPADKFGNILKDGSHFGYGK